MLHPDLLGGEHPIPPEGAIDEAVEIAKGFCGPDAPGFVNGILGAVLRDVRENGARSWLSPTRWTRSCSASSTSPPSCAPAAWSPSAPPRWSTSVRGLAADAGAELDRRVRAGEGGPGAAGQLALGLRALMSATSETRPSAPYPDHLRASVEAYLDGLRFSAEPATAGLEEAMRYSLLAGGKRIRPVLALATASATGREPGSVLPLAAALELIHTYSLIHDDLPAMDDDDLRRGRPTCHVKYGEDVAILAGDGLYAEAFRLVLHEQEGEPAGILAAVGELAAATGVTGMVGGQYIDVRSLVETGDDEPAAAARAQDRAADRGVRGVRIAADGPQMTLRLHSLTSATSPPSWASCSRSWTTSWT